ncbi:MAG: hypothetical protein VR70_10505 [Rhodospirillaceae bacterium BRH_c57]|nr:MAG: hypothetical protein VR70_10505 [Rhodospirillaceae bacterium BRH_c57]
MMPDHSPVTLLDQVLILAPELKWEPARYTSRREEVSAHGLPNRRWVKVECLPGDRYIVAVTRTIRETLAGSGPKADRVTASRTWIGTDLAPLLTSALADPLEAVTVAGLLLWPVPGFYSDGEAYADDSGRYTFSRRADVWEWKVNSPAAEKAMHLLGRLSGFYGMGGEAASLPEAVADALDAPRRFAAMVEVLAAELAQATPLPDPWTYAAVIAARDGERAFVGPCAELLDLKDQLTPAESPFIGRMDTAASYIVAVPFDQAADMDAAALIDHPAALRLDRY